MEEPIELVTEYQRKLNKNSSAISREHLKVLGIKKQTDISSYFAILDADIKFSRPIWWWVIDIFTVQEDFENIDTAEFAKDFVENDAFFVLDHSADPVSAEAITEHHFSKLFELFDLFKIPKNRIIVLSPCLDYIFWSNNYTQSVVRKRELIPYEGEYKHFTFNRLFKLSQWAFNYYGEMYGRGKITNFEKQVECHFLSMSRRDSYVRRFNNYLYHKNDYFNKGIISHNRISDTTIPNEDSENEYYLKQFKTRDDFDTALYRDKGHLKHHIDELGKSYNYRYKGITFNDYHTHNRFSKKVCFEVVIESQAENLFITEKTLKPIVCKSPFLFIGPPYGLAYLKKLGFETYESVFNEDYDKEQIFYDRMLLVHKNIERLTQMSVEECHAYLSKTKEILDFNHNHFLNSDWSFNLNSNINNYITKTLA